MRVRRIDGTLTEAFARGLSSFVAAHYVAGAEGAEEAGAPAGGLVGKEPFEPEPVDKPFSWSGVPTELNEVVATVEEPFSVAVLRLAEERGLSDVQVCHRARRGLSVVSKLRDDVAYRPDKREAVALALALRLTMGETQELIAKAGHRLARTCVADLVVEFCIGAEVHRLADVNAALRAYRQRALN